MNYRHAFHAGNFADVHKHIVLVGLIERLKRKPKPLFYLDTHAGRGWYELRGEESARGNEWRAGVARLAERRPAAADLTRYLEAVGVAQSGPTRYPGSPILAIRALRNDDRVVLVEHQPAEAQALQEATKGRRDVAVIWGDGYAALKAYLPPRENRGLVLIDPPFESADEFSQAAAALQLGLERWPNGMFMLWYPIKAGGERQRLHATLRAAGLRKLLNLELTVQPADSPIGLNGSGIVIANPPWQFDVEIAPALVEAHAALASDAGGESHVEWLVGE